jgi:hypothetical protein
MEAAGGLVSAARATVRLSMDSPVALHEVDSLLDDPELARQVRACCEGQKAASEALLRDFVPDPRALDHVSPAALDALLSAGVDRSDIRTVERLSDCVVFNTGGLGRSLLVDEVFALRRSIDERIAELVEGLFAETEKPALRVSGHFMYPPGGHMGWHTNTRVPGWRLYINHVEEEGRSFLRYRDPRSGEIVTSLDRAFSCRLFRIDPAQPLWHAVHSETFRYSLGYNLTRPPR